MVRDTLNKLLLMTVGAGIAYAIFIHTTPKVPQCSIIYLTLPPQQMELLPPPVV